MSLALTPHPGARSDIDSGLTVSVNLDANANVAPTAAVTAAVVNALSLSANPSSAHGAGETARGLLARARDELCELIDNAYPENVVFTSGCTEANNQIVASARARQARLITTAVEHPSILRPAAAWRPAGVDVRILPVDGDGLVDLAELERALADSRGPTVVSIQAANSETGVRQPLEVIARLVRRHADALFHADAAQALGKVHLTLGGAGPDVITLSGHKLHAPMGVGALVLAEGETRLHALLLGGEQESGLRAGTQSLPLIAGFGSACAERRAGFASQVAHMALLRDALERGLTTALPRAWVNGVRAPRTPNTSNIGFPGVDATALVAQLDAEGIFASQGSACHSHRPEPSPVLRAMGLSEADAYASIRFSVSPLNTLGEIEAAIPVIVRACHRLGIRT